MSQPQPPAGIGVRLAGKFVIKASPSLGQFPDVPKDLKVRVVRTTKGDGFDVDNLGLRVDQASSSQGIGIGLRHPPQVDLTMGRSRIGPHGQSHPHGTARLQ